MRGQDEDEQLVMPDGLTVRRMRHEHSWSPRELVAAIERASLIASGLRMTITPNLLQHIEEKSERIPYTTLCLLARALDCDPADIRTE